MSVGRAIVIGAGVGGLTSALALARAGFEVTVYERAGALEEFGAGLQLTPNATRVLSKFGAIAEVREAATVPESVCVLRGADDTVLMRLSLGNAERRWGAPYLAMHRADLQEALARVVRRDSRIHLRFGSVLKKATPRDETVAVEIVQGETVLNDTAALLIGADGLRSRVRPELSTDPADLPSHTGRVAFRSAIPAHLVDSRWTAARVVLRLGPHAHLVHYPLRRGSVVNVVAVIDDTWREDSQSRPWDGVADEAALKRAFASWSTSTRKLLAAASNWRAWPLYGRPALGTFAVGRIALVGDAAHPMVPFLAQGAAQAIEDAGALAEALAQTEYIPQALAAYSRARVARATRVQTEALRQGQIYHMKGVMAVARDAAMRVIGSRGLSSRYDWLYGV